jgi:hypothetical protein
LLDLLDRAELRTDQDLSKPNFSTRLMRWRASSGEQMKLTDATCASSGDSGRSARSIEQFARTPLVPPARIRVGGPPLHPGQIDSVPPLTGSPFHTRFMSSRSFLKVRNR